MQSVVCRLADINVKINYPYPSFEKFAAGYLVAEGAPPDMEITVSAGDIAREREGADAGMVWPDAYLQTLAVYRKFCTAVAARGILLFHGSAVAAEGKAYIFAAPSGTGKSTHAALWRRVYGEKVRMINDDKPLLRFIEGGIAVYGTPWNGKHRLGGNFSSPLGGICFLERGKENSIRPLSPREGFPRLLAQCFLPEEESAAAAALGLAQRLARETPLHLLACNISEEAARLSYAALTGKGDGKKPTEQT